MTVGPTPSPKGVAPQPKVLLLDLDDTLYRNHEVPTIVKERIQGEHRSLGLALSSQASSLVFASLACANALTLPSASELLSRILS